MTPNLSALPGGDLVMRGLEVPGPARAEAELALYRLLTIDGTEDPYATYNSLLRRLTSCAAALEHDLHRR